MRNRAVFLAFGIMASAIVSAPILEIFELEALSGAAFIAGILLLWVSSAAIVLRRLTQPKRD